MEKINDLRKLLKHELDDLYSAETQLIDALPKMAEKASNKQLKAALSGHLKVTRTQRERLGKVRKILSDGKAPAEQKGFFASLFSSKEGDEHCKAMEGLIKEAESLMKEDMTPEVMDAAIIAAAQKAEHYEISSYGTAKAYAHQLGLKDVAQLLNTTLDEEYAADDSLTALAVGKVNIDAENDSSEAKRTVRGTESGQTKTTAKKTAAKSTTSKTVAKSAGKSAVKKTAVKKKQSSR